MKGKADIGVMLLKGSQRLPTNHQGLERDREQVLPQPSEGPNPADTLISDLQPPERGRIHLCCLSPQSVMLCHGSPSRQM